MLSNSGKQYNKRDPTETVWTYKRMEEISLRSKAYEAKDGKKRSQGKVKKRIKSQRGEGNRNGEERSKVVVQGELCRSGKVKWKLT